MGGWRREDARLLPIRLRTIRLRPAGRNRIGRSRNSLSPDQIAQTYSRPVHAAAGAQRQPQQARCVSPLDGARQHGCPSLEEQQLSGTAENLRH